MSGTRVLDSKAEVLSISIPKAIVVRLGDDPERVAAAILTEAVARMPAGRLALHIQGRNQGPTE